MKIWLHQVAGRTLEVNLHEAPDSVPIAFDDVTDAEFHIQFQDGGTATVTDVALANQTPTTLRLLVTFDDVAPEIVRAGMHTWKARLTMTGTTVPEWTKPQQLRVLGPYEVERG